MTDAHLALLAAAIFFVALLYSCVGHAGASGYIATMALFGLLPAALKPTALVLNILVAVVAATQFARAGLFSWRLFWPFAVTSVPTAFVGGAIELPVQIYRPFVGAILLFSAVRLLIVRPRSEQEVSAPPIWAALAWGVVLGFVSGLTGVGGGIFLSPLLLFMGWATTRQASGAAAMFILVNSIAGLAGHLGSVRVLPSFIPYLALAALAGGAIGAYFGSRRLPAAAIYRALAAVLTVAGLKLIFV